MFSCTRACVCMSKRRGADVHSGVSWVVSGEVGWGGGYGCGDMLHVRTCVRVHVCVGGLSVACSLMCARACRGCWCVGGGMQRARVTGQDADLTGALVMKDMSSSRRAQAATCSAPKAPLHYQLRTHTAWAQQGAWGQ